MGYTQPIVALTANAIVGQAEMFLNNGFDDFISKPIDIRQLNASLNKLIRDKQPPEVIEKARQEKAGREKQTAIKEEPPAGLQLAEVFIRDAEKAVSVLEDMVQNNYRRNNDVQMFIINVHAMKSALANIGEPELSAAALKLEQAGRAENFDVMTEETPAFLEALRALIEKNKPKDEGETAEDTPELRAYLRENLLAIQKACRAYDKKAAKNILAELREKTWPRAAKELINSIGEHLLHSEFDEAADMVKELEGYN
jgi:CheY-like chemotaxis protein